MKINFDLNNNIEIPELVLGKKNYNKLGVITNMQNLSYEYNLMGKNSISFTVHKSLNGERCCVWDKIKDRKLVWIKDFDEWFQISVKKDETNSLIKNVTGISLCEEELSNVYLYETEINTEDDIARDDYEVTTFYNPGTPSASLINRILKKVPSYRVSHVDETLWDIQRTFSFDGSNIYDVFMNDIANEIGCLFLFDSRDRSVSAYDLYSNCNHCGHRGDFTDVCEECGSPDINYGYGNDTSIFVVFYLNRKKRTI